jgi:hypothetical protein
MSSSRKLGAKKSVCIMCWSSKTRRLCSCYRAGGRHWTRLTLLSSLALLKRAGISTPYRPSIYERPVRLFCPEPLFPVGSLYGTGVYASGFPLNSFLGSCQE